MKKNWTLIFVLALSLLLTACGSSADSESKLVVGATNVPHAEILEEAAPLLEERELSLRLFLLQTIFYRINH